MLHTHWFDGKLPVLDILFPQTPSDICFPACKNVEFRPADISLLVALIKKQDDENVCVLWNTQNLNLESSEVKRRIRTIWIEIVSLFFWSDTLKASPVSFTVHAVFWVVVISATWLEFSRNIISGQFKARNSPVSQTG